MPKVLVVMLMLREPTGLARLFGRALQSQFNQTWDGRLDHVILNGGDDYSDPEDTVTGKYQAAREIFLNGDWTHFYALEHDMLVPPDALQKLIALDADIAYGLYIFRHKIRKAFPWSAMSLLTETEWKSVSEDADFARRIAGQVIPVAGCGLGCTLIKRSVLEVLPFWHSKGVNCDWCLAVDAQKHGFLQLMDTSVQCGHMAITPSPGIYSVDVNTPELYRWESLI